MLKLIAPILIVAFLMSPASALAANPPGTGRPNVECGIEDDEFGPTPGRAAAARGSAFNEAGIGHEAYETAQAPSQYDTACFQQAQH